MKKSYPSKTEVPALRPISLSVRLYFAIFISLIFAKAPAITAVINTAKIVTELSTIST